MDFDFLNNDSNDALDQYDKVLKEIASDSEVEEIQLFIESEESLLDAAKAAKLAGFDKKGLTLLYSIVMLELDKRKEAFALMMSAYQLNANRGRECY